MPEANSGCVKCGRPVYARISHRSGNPVVLEPLFTWAHECSTHDLKRFRGRGLRERLDQYAAEANLAPYKGGRRIVVGDRFGVHLDDVFKPEVVNRVKCPDCLAEPGDPCINKASKKVVKYTVRPHTQRAWCFVKAVGLRLDGITLVSEELFNKKVKRRGEQ